MTDDDLIYANQAHWDELAAHHPKTEFYDVEAFLDGESSIDAVELEGAKPVADRSLLHLQCHFGMDTLSWVREGAARAVGVDFSSTAIETARELAEETGLDDRTEFVESDLYDLPDVLDESFDVVFTSYGVINWLPDVEEWAEVVAHFLKPGGRFFIVELHPISHVLMDLSVDEEGVVRSNWPYFTDEPQTYDEEGTYADYEAEVENTVTHEWSHSLGDVVTALVDAGLVIDELREYPYACFEQFPGQMREREDGNWVIPGEDYPLTFSIRAHKPGE
ncbi:MAG: class I SAM-dependent methyltransferase [Halanaeroarchaeum sp.]